MPKTPSIMKLHLRYRFFIAEMNLDINILRIFDDYLTEMQLKGKETEASGWQRFKTIYGIA